jgi:hypothetical protein
MTNSTLNMESEYFLTCRRKHKEIISMLIYHKHNEGMHAGYQVTQVTKLRTVVA